MNGQWPIDMTSSRAILPPRRRVASAVLALLWAAAPARARDASSERRWYEAAVAMREQALSWGDQPYGAVLVRDGQIVAYGPSRVVKNRNPDAHAEREAIREALAKLGPDGAKGSILVSTSRPCWACEQAAARAGVSRLIFGAELEDAGAPRKGL
jgi:tRNA(Arg) A34 adenosine deaminase TadA